MAGARDDSGRRSRRADAGNDVAVVVPTIGRRSLAALLRALTSGEGGSPTQIVVVDDRRADRRPPLPAPGTVDGVPVRWLSSDGRGPAAARNLGWRCAYGQWVVFVDDDVLPRPDWTALLTDDLRAAGPDVVAVQGQIHVPLPTGRRPTDWERGTAGLAGARWATADIAYRRRVLVELGGFDERFPRAYREDADLGLRARALGRIATGARMVDHPVRPAPWTASIARQAGNADDALMTLLHGRRWRARAGAPAGRRRRHAAVTAAGSVGLAALAAGHRRTAASACLAWGAGTAELAWRRIAPGPRDGAEVATMVATSVAIPPLAVGWWLVGMARHLGRVAAWSPGEHSSAASPVAAVFFDRDGTLIDDVPYNGDPSLVRPRPGADRALERLRSRGVPIAMVSNQSGVGTGRITLDQVHDVNGRTTELLGPFDAVLVCPHAATEGCACRKPQPRMLLDAAERLRVDPRRCVMVGDIGTDILAAQGAGARAVLVPTGVTRSEEIVAAPAVAADLEQAVTMILAGQA